jgi:hypothetical protein
MGEKDLAVMVAEHVESYVHPFTQARTAIVEAIAIVAQREELAEIVGPVGPRLSASEMHPPIWGAAATIWDNGHYRQAVQSASSAVESVLQGVAGPGVSGENLAALFSLNEPTPEMPRLRFRDIEPDPTSRTWKSAHEGAAAMVRAAFLGVRNLVSHPGWPDPTYTQGLEMLSTTTGPLAGAADKPIVGRTGTPCSDPPYTFGRSSDGYSVWCVGDGAQADQNPFWKPYTP